MAKILRLGKKKNYYLCFALDFSYLCKQKLQKHYHDETKTI